MPTWTTTPTPLSARLEVLFVLDHMALLAEWSVLVADVPDSHCKDDMISAVARLAAAPARLRDASRQGLDDSLLYLITWMRGYEAATNPTITH